MKRLVGFLLVSLNFGWAVFLLTRDWRPAVNVVGGLLAYFLLHEEARRG